jgi:hypothetical protein
LINAYRTENGIETLDHDERLAASMQAHLIHEKQHGFLSPDDSIDAPESCVETPEMRARACGTSMTAWVYDEGTTSEQVVLDDLISVPELDEIILDQRIVRAGAARLDEVWAILFGE